MSLVGDLRKASPTTLAEGAYYIILNSLAILMLLQPEGLLFIRGITIPPILQQPGWLAILIIVGAPCVLLLTKYGRHVRENT